MKITPTREEMAKLEELQMIVNEWIVSGKYVNYLLDFRRSNDPKWVDREVVCYILKENVFHQIDNNKLTNILSIADIVSLSSDNVRITLGHLSNFIEKQFNFEKVEWEKQEKLCGVMEMILWKCKDSLSFQTSDLMFDYLMRLVERLERDAPIDSGLEFKFDKFQSLLFLLINSMEKQLNKTPCEWDRHRQLGDVLMTIEKKYKVLSTQDTCNLIFDYLMKLIEKCDDEKTIESAFGALAQFSLDQYSLKFNKYEPSLVKLIDLGPKRIDKLNKRDKCAVIENVLKWKDLSSSLTLERIFDYLVKLIGTCDQKEAIASAWSALRQFPFHKYQSSLLNLIDLMENKDNEEPSELDRHLGMCEVMQNVFVHKDSLSKQTLDRMYDLLLKLIETNDHKETISSAWKALSLFPFEKNQTLLLHLMDLMEKEVNKEQCNWYKPGGLCGVMKAVLDENGTSLNPQTHTRMFEYIKKVIVKCDDLETLDSVWAALIQFPFEKYHIEINKNETSLQKLIGFQKNQLESEMRFTDKLSNLCNVMQWTLENCQDLLSTETFEQIFAFILSLVNQWKDNKMINQANHVLVLFPFHKYQSSLVQLVDSVENKLNNVEQPEWDNHAKLCSVMEEVLWKYKEALSKETCERMFNYLVKLIERCDDEDTIYSAIDILRIFPFDQHEALLMRLFELVENHSKPKQNGFNKVDELCELIDVMLYRYKNAFSKQNYDRISDYLKKNKISRKGVESGYDTASEMSFKSATSSNTLTKLIKLNNQLSPEQAIGVIKNFLQPHSGQFKVLFPKICEYLINDLKSLKKNANMQHNWCTALKQLVPIGELNLLSQNAENLLFDYLLQLFYDCGNDMVKTILLGILLVEQMILMNEFKNFQMNSLKDKLNSLYLTNKCSFLDGLPENFDCDRYQVGWCARWCVDNLIEENNVKELPLIKLSNDRLGARKDTDGCIPVRSAFPVKSGTFYYEVILISQEGDKIGWSTRNSTFGLWDQRQNSIDDGDDDAHLIAFDIHNKCIVGRNVEHKIVNNPPLQSPNVVGCLIDVENRKFVFYLNGQIVDCGSIDIHFSTSAYYATASLRVNQQYYFNFGQVPFKYPLENVSNFNDATERNVRKFQLLDTEIVYDDIIWFNHLIFDNQIEPLYCDSKQCEFDNLVRKLEEDPKTRMPDLTQLECIRFIQSIIEVMQTELHDYEYIQQMFTQQLEEEKESDKFRIKIYQLIFPYTQLKLNDGNRTKCHNVCVIIAEMLNHFPNIPQVIHQFAVNFILSNKFISFGALTKDCQLVINALTGLDKFIENDQNRKMLKKDSTFKANLRGIIKYAQIENISCLYDQDAYFRKVQAGVCAKWLYDRNYLDTNKPKLTSSSEAVLNSLDKSAYLKLSSDQLSARSDHRWQSVRSIGCAKSNVYYFEVILLTDGPMKIGWATKRTDLNKLCHDKYSILFDGFNRCFQYDGEIYPLPDIQRWKAGDVIGCLIYKDSSQNVFSHNGDALPLPPNMYFSSQPYHAAASLSSHQQVYFNFGQAPFKYGPQHIDYRYFDLDISYRQNIIKNSVVIVNSTISNANISFEKSNNIGNLVLAPPSKSPFLKSKSFKTNKKDKLNIVLNNDSIQSSSKDLQSNSPMDIVCLTTETTSKKSTNRATHLNTFSHKWMIENFNLFSKESATSLPVIYSKSFPSSKLLQFSLRLLPNCANNDETSFISIFLYLENNRLENYSKIPVNYKISIVDSGGEIVYFQEKTDNIQQEESRGWEHFIEKDRLRKFLQNHKLTLLCKLSIDSTEIDTEILNKEPIRLFQTENSFDFNKKINRLTHVWKIQNFNLYFYDKQAPKYVKSDTFPAQRHKANNKYYLRLWPKGINEESSEFVSLYLTLETSEQSEHISVQYRVSVLNRRGKVFHTGEGRIYSNSERENLIVSTSKGSSKFLPLEQITNPENGLLPKDVLTIYCEIWEIMDHENYKKKILDACKKVSKLFDKLV